MPITVEDVVRSPGLQVRVVAGRSGLGGEVRWAHVIELADPVEWLRGGELVLTVGLGLPESAEERRGYVRRLRGAGCVGLGFAPGTWLREVPAEVAAEADAVGLPLLVVEGRTPFVAVVEAVADLHARARLAAQHRVLAAQDAMARAALSGGAAAVLRELAGATGGEAALADGWGVVREASGAARPWHTRLGPSPADRRPRGVVILPDEDAPGPAAPVRPGAPALFEGAGAVPGEAALGPPSGGEPVRPGSPPEAAAPPAGAAPLPPAPDGGAASPRPAPDGPGGSAGGGGARRSASGPREARGRSGAGPAGEREPAAPGGVDGGPEPAPGRRGVQAQRAEGPVARPGADAAARPGGGGPGSPGEEGAAGSGAAPERERLVPDPGAVDAPDTAAPGPCAALARGGEEAAAGSGAAPGGGSGPDGGLPGEGRPASGGAGAGERGAGARPAMGATGGADRSAGPGAAEAAGPGPSTARPGGAEDEAAARPGAGPAVPDPGGGAAGPGAPLGRLSGAETAARVRDGGERPEGGGATVLVQDLAAPGAFRLALRCPGPVPVHARMLANHAATLLAAELHAAAQARRVRLRERSRALAALLRGDRVPVPPLPAPPLEVAVLPASRPEALMDAVADVLPEVLGDAGAAEAVAAAPVGDALAVVFPARGRRRAGGALLRALGGAEGAPPACGGCSARGPEGLRAAVRRARREAAAGPGYRHVEDADPLARIGRSLGGEADEFVASVLGRLREHDARNGTELVPSLRAYFEHGGVESAARALDVHRNTLRTRLRTAERLSGRGLVGRGRLELELALAFEAFLED
ncbi:PucR family transcriptional regulator [Nocardiopsis sp. CNT-189]|uniref:PucR family transcriptional regulator n=1 Tax=Nocardiopsis oceanisediminis TaxID=2816862 RepID=UPI003B37321E